MKIAITADNHLTTRAKNPERFQAFKNILEQCGEHEIQLLTIAGDLFDKSLANYAEFEELYQANRPDDLTTVIIPGNHDLGFTQASVAGDGLQVYSEPTIRPLNDSRLVLFLPYQENSTMGEAIAPFADQLAGKRWILVGHGDWSSALNSSDPYEPGSYMPLTKADLSRYQPEIVFLGHIHLPQNSDTVYYPGSPCPLNITETGTRRFLVLDTTRGEVASHLVESHLLYFDEQIIMLPVKNDLEILERDLEERIKTWSIPDGWEKFVKVRVKIKGCAYSDRQATLDKTKELLKPYQLYDELGPDLRELVHNQDPDRAEITAKFKNWLDDLQWATQFDLPDKTEILEQALRIIYQHLT
ncbi:MAG: metallophosphoesterase [Anaerolineales bacterium]